MWVLQWLVQGSLVATAATAAVALVPATSPRLRHQLWWFALASVLVLPWLAPLIAPHAPQGVVSHPAARALTVEVAPPPAWVWDAVAAVWTCSLLWAAAALASDLSALQLLKRVSRPLAQRDAPISEALYRSLPAVRGARLAVSDEVTGACAVGFLAPRILLSSRLLTALEPAALDMIVRHELAHLERFDDWLRLLQRVVLAFAGLHPAVRWISRQIDVEREAACDRLVVDRVGGEALYARALTTVADVTARIRRGVPHLAPGAAGGTGGFELRIERILRQPLTAPWALRLASVAGTTTLGLAVTFAAGLPPLVSVTTFEPALRVLASLPAGRTFVPRVPRLDSRTLSDAEPAERLGPRLVPIESALPSSDVVVERADPDTDRNAPPGEAAPLARIDLLDVPAARTASLTVPLTPGVPLDVATAGIGTRAARAGAATGASAARAGTAVGRFFSRGGRSVADRF